MAKKTNIKDLGIAKSQSIIEWFENGRQFFPGKDESRKRLMYSIYEFAEDPDTLIAGEFFARYRIKQASFYEWIKKDEELLQAWTQAKTLLSYKKLRGALNRTLDKEVVFKDLYKYDAEWDEIDKRNAEIKKASAPPLPVEVLPLLRIEDTGIPTPEEKKSTLNKGET